MNTIERLLVVIDAEEDYSAAADGLPIELRKALRFATDKANTKIKLLSVGYEKYLSHSFHSLGYDYMMLRKEYVERMSLVLQEMGDKLKAQGYQISTEVAWAHPRYEVIVEKADEFNADLVVQHCRAYAKIEHYSLTNDSWQLVRTCSRPLLLVKEQDWNDKPVLIAAVDPMHTHNKPLRLDNLILDAASTISTQLGGEFHIVHAYAEAARPFAAAGQIKDAHTEAFNELMADYDFDDKYVHLIDETPIYALQHYAETLHTDVIVMGAISRSRLSEALIGSTAERVIDYIKNDILILTPKAQG